MTDEADETSSEQELSGDAYHAADKMLSMVARSDLGDVARSALERTFDAPAKRRDLYDLIHAQDETNFRVLLALTSIVSGNETATQRALQLVVDGMREQGVLTARIAKSLTQLAFDDVS